MIHDLMWAHPKLFVVVVCGAATFIAAAICFACFSVKQEDGDG